MKVRRSGKMKPYSLPPSETETARGASEAIAELAPAGPVSLLLRLDDPGTGRLIEVVLPPSVLSLLTEALTQMAGGSTVALASMDVELSTQQAADLLGVSRPHVVKLVEAGSMPHRKVGNQRRIRVSALRQYAETYQREALSEVGAMAAEAQRNGLYE